MSCVLFLSKRSKIRIAPWRSEGRHCVLVLRDLKKRTHALVVKAFHLNTKRKCLC